MSSLLLYIIILYDDLIVVHGRDGWDPDFAFQAPVKETRAWNNMPQQILRGFLCTFFHWIRGTCQHDTPTSYPHRLQAKLDIVAADAHVAAAVVSKPVSQGADEDGGTGAAKVSAETPRPRWQLFWKARGSSLIIAVRNMSELPNHYINPQKSSMRSICCVCDIVWPVVMTMIYYWSSCVEMQNLLWIFHSSSRCLKEKVPWEI